MDMTPRSRHDCQDIPAPARGGLILPPLASALISAAFLLASGQAHAASTRADTSAAPTIIKDCDDICPAMAIVPAGAFDMGSAVRDESPIRRVVFTVPFAIAQTETTFAQWDACVADGGCPEQVRRVPVAGDQGWGRGDRPVINVTWAEATTYTRWLSRKTGQNYRLPTEAEWEYAARSGSDSVAATPEGANYAGSGLDKTQPVGTYPANALGLHDMLGNVWEWVEDCYAASYDGAPTDGSARATPRCERRVLRGGAWNAPAEQVRATMRGRNPVGQRGEDFGFRVVREIRD